MSLINDSHAIGVDTRNLVLKTRGTLHVKAGDTFYEIDFRNLSKNNEEVEEKEKEEYIITINDRDQINLIEYPGDNKLIIGLDNSIFVTKNNSFIEITSNKTVANKELKNIETLDSVHVRDRFYGDSSLLIDFNNSEIIADKLTVTSELDIPKTSVKNRCTKTFINNEEVVNSRYETYDFIELLDIPSELVVKSGVLIKSRIKASIMVYIEDYDGKEMHFEKDDLYIIYVNDEELIQTKLN